MLPHVSSRRCRRTDTSARPCVFDDIPPLRRRIAAKPVVPDPEYETQAIHDVVALPTVRLPFGKNRSEMDAQNARTSDGQEPESVRHAGHAMLYPGRDGERA